MLGEVEALVHELLDGRAELFEARVSAGPIVDGYGDLLAVRILDCLEFDDALLFLDQLDERPDP